MRVRQLSPTGDYLFGASQAQFLIDSPAAIAQRVGTALRLIMGEWYLDNTVGLPLFEEVIGYHNQADADAAYQNTINSITVIISSTNVPAGTQPGQTVQAVTAINNYASTIDPITRAYSATCDLDTIYGPTPLQITNETNF